MKTHQGLSKSRSASAAASKKKAALAVSSKRLRRLQQISEDDDDDEESEEEELSTSLSHRLADKKRRVSDAKAEFRGAIDFDNSLVIDFDPLDGASAPDSAASTLFNSVGNRDFDQQPLQSDEMDQLQFQLERELAQAVWTRRKLRSALKQLSATSHGSHSQTAARSTSGSATISNKRKFPKTQQLPKRPASASMATFSSLTAAKRNRIAGNKDRKAINHESKPTCSRSYYYAQQNHQMPDKFWSFVDQYAGQITSSDDLDFVRDLAHETDCRSSESKCYYDIPNLKGTRRPSSSASSAATSRGHSGTVSPAQKPGAQSKFGKAAAVKKQLSEAKDGSSGSLNESKSSNKRAVATSTASTAPPSSKRVRHNSRMQNGTSTSKNSGKHIEDDNGLTLGPFTERLVQALIEDYGNNSDNAFDGAKNGRVDLPKNGQGATSSKAFIKTLNLGNLKALENKIKKELIEQGLLDPDNEQADRKRATASRRESVSSRHGRSSAVGLYEECADDDEVTAELKRRQFELSCVQRTNHERLSDMLAKAETQVEKAQVEELVRKADEEVLDLCSRYYGVAPASRKPSGKKERDALWKALKDRQKAIAKLKKVE